MSENELLILLEKQNKYIEEKLESDKVLEGLLRDINCGIDRIADALNDINIRRK